MNTPAPITFDGLTDEDPVNGSWMNSDLTEFVNIYKVTCASDPRTLEHEDYEPVYFPVKEYEGDDGHTHWTFWTGTRHKRVGSLADGRGIYEKTAIDEATVARQKAYRDWYDAAHNAGT